MHWGSLGEPGAGVNVTRARSGIWALGPHELLGGLLFLACGLRAFWNLGWADAGAWIPWILLAAGCAVVRWDLRVREHRTAQWRLLMLPIAFSAYYFRLGIDLPRLGAWRADRWLLGWDRHWLGETPALRLSAVEAVWLTEMLSACYLAYFVALGLYQVGWLRARHSAGHRFFRGFYCVYALGFLGYCLLPAGGPCVVLADQFAPMKLGWIGEFNDWVVRMGCNRVDVFPSLHVASTCYFLGFDAKEGRWRRFLWMLVPGLGLCFSTLYLRYHYAVDMLAGVLLAGVGVWVSRWHRIWDGGERGESRGF